MIISIEIRKPALYFMGQNGKLGVKMHRFEVVSKALIIYVVKVLWEPWMQLPTLWRTCKEAYFHKQNVWRYSGYALYALYHSSGLIPGIAIC